MIPVCKGTLKSLSQLILRCWTDIEEQPPSSIEGLTALEILDLRGCDDLQCLPSNMDSLRSLKFLYLSGCSKLANLPENLWKMKCLEKLYLSEMSQLEEIELNGIGCLSSLKYLSLRSYNFVTPPAIFSQLSKLESLDLSFCDILRSVSVLPSTIRYINMKCCCSLEPSPALLRQSSLSRPCSSPFFRGYDESSGGVAFTILNRYLQVISSFSLFDSFSSLVKWNIMCFFFFFFGYRDSCVKKLDMKLLPKEKKMDLKLNFRSLFPDV